MRVPLPITNKYKVILADPAWKYSNLSTVAQGAAKAHYPTMSPAEIKALPVREISEDSCVLFLWSTMPQLPVALSVMEAWGFKYITVAFTWVKHTKHGKWWSGLGYYTRANAELCLLGKRGKPTLLDTRQRQLVIAPIIKHSQKPEEVQDRIEKMYEGPYIELFARRQRLGWSCWGEGV